MSAINSLDLFPSDCITTIFEKCDIAELEICKCVSKRWEKLATGLIEKFWKKQINGTLLSSESEDFKNQLIKHRPKSYKAFLEHIKQFLAGVEKGSYSRFSCLLGSIQRYTHFVLHITQRGSGCAYPDDYCLCPLAWLPSREADPRDAGYEASRWRLNVKADRDRQQYKIRYQGVERLSAELSFPRLNPKEPSLKTHSGDHFFHGQTELESTILYDLLKPKFEELAYDIPVTYQLLPRVSINLSDQELDGLKWAALGFAAEAFLAVTLLAITHPRQNRRRG